jgi:maltose O-acetyltransferase
MRYGVVVNVRRLADLAREERGGSSCRLLVATWVNRLLPDLVGNRVRASMLRWAGVRIAAGTVIGGGLTIVGGRRPDQRVTIGANCWINAGCYLDANGTVEIGDDVAIAQQVLILTTTHRIAGEVRRAGETTKAPVRIEDSAWIGARATILPGVTVGRGSIVAAGAVVNADVPADTVVAGVPARVIRELDGERPGTAMPSAWAAP